LGRHRLLASVVRTGRRDHGRDARRVHGHRRRGRRHPDGVGVGCPVLHEARHGLRWWPRPGPRGDARGTSAGRSEEHTSELQSRSLHDALPIYSDDIAFWHLLSGPDGVTMGEMLDGYMATDGAADVTQTVLAWGAPYYTKLAMASAGGRAPDLAVMHAARVPGYAPGGLLDEWDLDLLGEFGIRQEDFPELVWEKMVVDGKLTAIALDSHPFVLYYNTEIAEAAGVLGN